MKYEFGKSLSLNNLPILLRQILCHQIIEGGKHPGREKLGVRLKYFYWQFLSVFGS
jgi:hypothetical protein